MKNYNLKLLHDIKNEQIEENDVYNMSDLNWKDETLENGIGDIDGSDPSMKGYNKGWQMDPYVQRYYANFEGGKQVKVSRLRKIAAVETIDISYSAKNYVNEILSIWKESDGPIQDFFDAFTSNGKVSNKDKKQMAELMRQKGYNVYPSLVDETVRYANNLYFRDIQLSDESLNNMENMLSENQESLVQRTNDNNNFNYNQQEQINSDNGVTPSNYEVVSRLKKNF